VSILSSVVIESDRPKTRLSPRGTVDHRPQITSRYTMCQYTRHASEPGQRSMSRCFSESTRKVKMDTTDWGT